MGDSRDLTVVRIGTDTSGRGLYMTRFMQDVWQAVKRHPKVAPFAHKLVIVQGAFMVRNGGGAAASAGYHDQAGCIDVRTWNLTTAELNVFVRACRRYGFAMWRRDRSWLRGGMDPHAHGTLGSDAPLTSGARHSWNGYLRGTNGLASGRPDYEWRPDPLVTFPPKHVLKEDYMASSAAERKLDQILGLVKDTREDLNTFRGNEVKRDRNAAKKARESKAALVSRIGGVMDALVEISNKLDDPNVDVALVQEQANKAFENLRVMLVEDPDVDGAENPADQTTDSDED